MKFINGLRTLFMPLKSAERVIEYIKAMEEIESEGDAGKITSVSLAAKLKERKIKFNIGLMTCLLSLGIVNMTRTPFTSKVGYVVFPYRWRLRKQAAGIVPKFEEQLKEHKLHLKEIEAEYKKMKATDTDVEADDTKDE